MQVRVSELAVRREVQEITLFFEKELPVGNHELVFTADVAASANTGSWTAFA